MASNLIKRTKSLTVIVKEGATAEELKDVRRLVECGWTSKPMKKKEKKEEIPHEITAEFNIGYDDVRKVDMVKYIKEFVKDENALKEFAIAAHKKVNGEPSVTEKGEPKFNIIAAKRYFYATYFKEEWKKIEKTLEDRKFKSKAAKEKNEIQKELLDLLKG